MANVFNLLAVAVVRPELERAEHLAVERHLPSAICYTLISKPFYTWYKRGLKRIHT